MRIKGLEHPNFKGAKNPTKEFRRVMHERANGVCALCGQPVLLEDMHLDHILPLRHGGKDHYTNMQITHPICNLSKGAGLQAGQAGKAPSYTYWRRREKAISQRIEKRRRQFQEEVDSLSDADEWNEDKFKTLFAEFKRHRKRIEQTEEKRRRSLGTSPG